MAAAVGLEDLVRVAIIERRAEGGPKIIAINVRAQNAAQAVFAMPAYLPEGHTGGRVFRVFPESGRLSGFVVSLERSEFSLEWIATCQQGDQVFERTIKMKPVSAAAAQLKAGSWIYVLTFEQQNEEWVGQIKKMREETRTVMDLLQLHPYNTDLYSKFYRELTQEEKEKLAGLTLPEIEKKWKELNLDYEAYQKEVAVKGGDTSIINEILRQMNLLTAEKENKIAQEALQTT